MNASCDKDTLSEITDSIAKVDPALHIKDIKVNKVGKMLEIIAVIYLPKISKISEAGSIITRIKESLDREISVLHEVHIGIVSE
jgi:divalent metal cation (Fe/Co/Zn/Cd) transporter